MIFRATFCFSISHLNFEFDEKIPQADLNRKKFFRKQTRYKLNSYQEYWHLKYQRDRFTPGTTVWRDHASSQQIAEYSEAFSRMKRIQEQIEQEKCQSLSWRKLSYELESFSTVPECLAVREFVADKLALVTGAASKNILALINHHYASKFYFCKYLQLSIEAVPALLHVVEKVRCTVIDLRVFSNIHTNAFLKFCEGFKWSELHFRKIIIPRQLLSEERKAFESAAEIYRSRLIFDQALTLEISSNNFSNANNSDRTIENYLIKNKFIEFIANILNSTTEKIYNFIKIEDVNRYTVNGEFTLNPFSLDALALIAKKLRCDTLDLSGLNLCSKSFAHFLGSLHNFVTIKTVIIERELNGSELRRWESASSWSASDPSNWFGNGMKNYTITLIVRLPPEGRNSPSWVTPPLSSSAYSSTATLSSSTLGTLPPIPKHYDSKPLPEPSTPKIQNPNSLIGSSKPSTTSGDKDKTYNRSNVIEEISPFSKEKFMNTRIDLTEKLALVLKQEEEVIKKFLASYEQRDLISNAYTEHFSIEVLGAIELFKVATVLKSTEVDLRICSFLSSKNFQIICELISSKKLMGIEKIYLPRRLREEELIIFYNAVMSCYTKHSYISKVVLVQPSLK